MVTHNRDLVRTVLAVVSWSAALGAGMAVSWKFYLALTPDILRDLVSHHFSGVIILPLSAMSALMIVTIFKTGSGPLEFEVLGFKLKGAAGESAMWIACFLAIAAAAKILF